MFYGEFKSVFVSFVLLFLRELRIGEGRHQFAQLRAAQLGQPASFRSPGSIAGRGCQVGVFHRMFCVGMDYVADFVPDDRHQFVVVHQIHQGAENADRTVAAGEGIDVGHIVNLEIERQPVDLGDTLGQTFEAGPVLGCLIGDGVVGVHPCYGFAAQLCDVAVAQGHRFGDILPGVEQFCRVEFLAADFQLGNRIPGPQDA